MKGLNPRYWSLAVKLPLTLAAAVVAVALTIGLAMVVQERQRIRVEIEDRALLAARSVALNSSEAMLRNDYWGLYKNLDQISRGAGGMDNAVVTAMILDKAGRVLAHLDPRGHPIGLRFVSDDPAERTRLLRLVESPAPTRTWGGSPDDAFVEAAYPVEANGSFIGLTVFRLSAAEINARTWSAAMTILGIAVTLALIGSAAGAYLSNRMVMPLRQLSAAMGLVARGAPDFAVPRVPIHDYDEIGNLVQSFQSMAAGIEEKRRLERELATSDKMIALGRIAAGVAHEVNNPLSGMLNCLSNIEHRPDDRALLERYLPMLRSGLHRIRGIVQSLLVELQVEEDMTWTSGECLDDVRDLVRAEAEERRVGLAWDNALGCDTHLQCRRVQQVVFNLLRNAVQAVAEEGTVEFRALRRGGAIVIEVEDDGVGIAAENLSRLFDPFYTSKPSGTGLGLWITYRLVESMKGNIEVESEPGRGSLFRVTLPAWDGVLDAQGGGTDATE